MIRRRAITILVLLLVAMQAFHVADADDPPKHIGMIVVGPSGEPQTACIIADQNATTGYDMLLASGLEINASVGPLGAAICAVNEVGCFFPAERCFCQCEGGRCSYWAYHFWDVETDGWRYSPLGASSRTLDHGDLELWVWRTADNEDQPLPDLTWDDICGGEQTSQRFERQSKQDDNISLATTVGYAAFGVLTLTAVAGVVWRQRRTL